MDFLNSQEDENLVWFNILDSMQLNLPDSQWPTDIFS